MAEKTAKPDLRHLIPDFREKFVKECKDKDKMYPEDLERLQTEDEYTHAFLYHQQGNLDNALKMVHGSFVWRKTFGVREVSEDTIPKEMFDSGFIYFHNKDKKGNPILLLNIINGGAAETTNKKNLLAYWLEKATTACADKQILVLMDISGTGLSHVDMAFTRFLIDCFTKHYPNSLACLVCYEMPWIMNTIWKIIKGWLSKEEQEHVRFDSIKTIGEIIDTEQLSVHMGGTDTFKYKYEPKQSYLQL